MTNEIQEGSGKKKISLLEIVMNNKAVFILIVLAIIAGSLSSNFFTVTNILNVLRQVAAATVMGMGYSCVIGSGNMDLSVGLMLGMLGIIGAKLDTTTEISSISFILLIVVVIGVGVLCGLFNSFLVNVFRLPAFIVTLATGQIFKGINYIVSNTSAISGLSNGYAVIGQGYVGPIPVPVVISICMTVLMSIVIYRTSFGRHIVSIGANREAAHVSGINSKRVLYGVYATMGACVAIASLIITGRANSAQPQSGQGMEMDAIAAVVIGGTRLGGGYSKPEGTFFGCLIVGLINNILNLLAVDTNWQWIAKGAIILFAIILDAQSERILERQRLKAKV